jgi:hypothetical protein
MIGVSSNVRAVFSKTKNRSMQGKYFVDKMKVSGNKLALRHLFGSRIARIPFGTSALRLASELQSYVTCRN